MVSGSLGGTISLFSRYPAILRNRSRIFTGLGVGGGLLTAGSLWGLQHPDPKALDKHVFLRRIGPLHLGSMIFLTSIYQCQHYGGDIFQDWFLAAEIVIGSLLREALGQGWIDASLKLFPGIILASLVVSWVFHDVLALKRERKRTYL